MKNRLTERFTIPITPQMRRRIEAVAQQQSMRPVDVGRTALSRYISTEGESYNELKTRITEQYKTASDFDKLYALLWLILFKLMEGNTNDY